MMNERARRNVARKFLEENFGKQGKHHLPINVITEISNMENGWKVLEAMFSITHNFELNKSWESMDADGKEAKAFEVIYAPYVSDADKQFIAVSDSRKELNEIVERVFPEDRRKHGFIEYDRYGKYYIAYD